MIRFGAVIPASVRFIPQMGEAKGQHQCQKEEMFSSLSELLSLVGIGDCGTFQRALSSVYDIWR